MIYSGKFYLWNVRQLAIAYAKYPHFPPTQQGIEQLQEMCALNGERIRSNRVEPANMTWARDAMSSIRTLKYEAVPA